MLFFHRMCLGISQRSVLFSAVGRRLTRELFRFNLRKRTVTSKRISFLIHILRKQFLPWVLSFRQPRRTLIRKMISEP